MQAIALRYEGVGAPEVVAKGEGLVTEIFIETARECGVPMYDDPQVAALLSRPEPSDEIPEKLYLAVARIIAFAYTVAGKMPPCPTTPKKDNRWPTVDAASISAISTGSVTP